MGTHQELEMFGSQPAYPEKLLHKKESLQNQLINIRVELSQASTVTGWGAGFGALLSLPGWKTSREREFPSAGWGPQEPKSLTGHKANWAPSRCHLGSWFRSGHLRACPQCCHPLPSSGGCAGCQRPP